MVTMDKPHPFTNGNYFINYSCCLTCNFEISLVTAQGNILILDFSKRTIKLSTGSNFLAR